MTAGLLLCILLSGMECCCCCFQGQTEEEEGEESLCFPSVGAHFSVPCSADLPIKGSTHWSGVAGVSVDRGSKNNQRNYIS